MKRPDNFTVSAALAASPIFRGARNTPPSQDDDAAEARAAGFELRPGEAIARSPLERFQTWLSQVRATSGPEIFVAAHTLALFVNSKKGYAEVSQSALARKIGIPLRTLEWQVARLRERGHLQVVRRGQGRGKGQKTALYCIVKPDCVPAIEGQEPVPAVRRRKVTNRNSIAVRNASYDPQLGCGSQDSYDPQQNGVTTRNSKKNFATNSDPSPRITGVYNKGSGCGRHSGSHKNGADSGEICAVEDTAQKGNADTAGSALAVAKRTAKASAPAESINISRDAPPPPAPGDYERELPPPEPLPLDAYRDDDGPAPDDEPIVDAPPASRPLKPARPVPAGWRWPNLPDAASAADDEDDEDDEPTDWHWSDDLDDPDDLADLVPISGKRFGGSNRYGASSFALAVNGGAA